VLGFGVLTALAALMAGCVASRPAPVSERTPPVKQAAPAPRETAQLKPAPAQTPAQPKRELYTVKPGDTLYSIALEHGLDYRELAAWNAIENPGALRAGQQLRVTAPPSSVAAAPSQGVVAAPLKAPSGAIEAKPLGPTGSVPPGVSAPPAGAISPAPSATPPSGGIVTEPKGVRMPYSDQALAQLSKPETVSSKPEVAQVKPEPPRAEAKTPVRPESDARPVEATDWIWPVKGKVIATFNGTTSKGIDIAGRRGQPVLASAGGRVIFSGTGVRGMGKFVVVKHTEELISVYGHNDEVLVKYGQNVAKGQKIAEMGSTDADQVKLHFEIRRHGTPVDPMKLLPEGPV
jgi:lipoprotein NlpD